MSVYCNKRKIIFIHVAKTGGGSIKKVLGANGFNQLTAHSAVMHFDKAGFNLDEYHKVAVIRNPWDRFYSSYKHLNFKETICEFEEFCENPEKMIIERRKKNRAISGAFEIS